MNTNTLNFVTLYVSDVNITANLLCRLFSWQTLYTVNKSLKHQVIHIGNDVSCLVIQPSPNAHLKADKLQHNLFNIGVAADDIVAVEEQVIKAGLQTYSKNVNLNQREFRFSDPDGIEYLVKGNVSDANEITQQWMKELGKISRFGAMIK